MKNLYTIKFASIFILLFITCFCEAQPFAPVGAKFYYSHEYANNLFFYNGYISVEATKDTIIQNHSTRILKITSSKDGLVDYAYVSQQGDSILYFNPYTNQFHMLYHFGAQVGDTIMIHNAGVKIPSAYLNEVDDSVRSFAYRIIQIDSINIDGNWYIEQHIEDVRASNSTWSMTSLQGTGKVNNLYGANTYLFGVSRMVHAEMIAPLLRCYNDIDVTYKNPEFSKECDHEDIFQSVSQIGAAVEVLIYPNPVNQTLMVQWLQNMHVNSVSVYNLNGQLILSEKSILNGIDVSMLSGGVYYVTITTNNGSVYRSKFVKL